MSPYQEKETIHFRSCSQYDPHLLDVRILILSYLVQRFSLVTMVHPVVVAQQAMVIDMLVFQKLTQTSVLCLAV